MIRVPTVNCRKSQKACCKSITSVSVTEHASHGCTGNKVDLSCLLPCVHLCALSSAHFLYHGLVVSNFPIPHLTADSAFQEEIGVRLLWYLNLYHFVFLYYCCLWKILYCSFRCECQGLKLLRVKCHVLLWTLLLYIYYITYNIYYIFIYFSWW